MRCECGKPAYPIRSPGTGSVIVYVCPEHGYLHHSALIYERSDMPCTPSPEEEQHTGYMHAVYVMDDHGNWMVNSTYADVADAFTKAKDVYDAWAAVQVIEVRTQLERP